jgi:flavin reductase (DIM6/NTAB) family NADH-FMN oxidoreductase RutF
MMEIDIIIQGYILNKSKDFLGVEEMRQAMRRWATGVTVVTSRQGEVCHGMTVSSFTSVSLSPPLVLVSLQSGTRTHELVSRSGVFGITLLSQGQEEISDRFAGRIAETEDRFLGLKTFTLATGVPFLDGGLANFDCEVLAANSVGDHAVFLGNVLSVRINQVSSPLIYYDRGYWRIDA